MNRREFLESGTALAARPAAAFSDYRRVLENRDVQAVVIATPDHWHPLITADACAAGKDVYISSAP